MSSKRIPIFISFSGEGGVERMVSNLIKEFVRQGYSIDLLLIKARGEHLKHLPKEVNIIKLGSDHTAFTLWPLIRYLRQHKPEAMLVAKHRAIMIALFAKILAGVNTRIVGRLGTNLSQALEGKSAVRKWFWHFQMRRLYPKAEKIIPVSEGVLSDVANITGLGADKLRVIHNPVITTEMSVLANEPIDHPWFTDKQSPIIIGAGRFTRQKDFITLIKAFAQVRQHKPCRLVLLGAGNLQAQYEQLADELGVRNDISMPGFMHNPYPYMKQADLFVLSSAWEGSPNVLSEALAMGTPVVATDCPSGPREVLQGGKIAPLVEVGDDKNMAEAMLEVLNDPPNKTTLQAAVNEYTAETSAQRYLQALGIIEKDSVVK
jgi:glycosyltransferase involved in cell wall biosynthesis